MTRINLSRAYEIPDIISTEAFKLVLGTIPNSIGNDEWMSLKCQNTNWPGFGNEAFDVPLHSFVRRFRGRKTYPRSLAATFVEDATFHTLKTLRSWHEFIVGTESGGSAGDSAFYSVAADLVMYNHKNEEIDRVTFRNLFIQDVPDVPLSGESSTLFAVPVTFSYDYFVPSGGNIL